MNYVSCNTTHIVLIQGVERYLIWNVFVTDFLFGNLYHYYSYATIACKEVPSVAFSCLAPD